MSKKDKKRIAELEKSLSNLIRMHVNLRDNYILHSIEQDKLKAFPAGTIPSGKEQEKTEQPDPILPKFTNFEAGQKYIKTALSRLEKEQEKTKQPQQSEAQKEQELMGQFNKELAKFSSLEAFNADRKNFFLPPIDKLQFDKIKLAIECSFAVAKMVRPELFDKIDQIKIPKEEQGETEQPKPESHRENSGEPILNKPNLPKSTLNKIVLSRIEEIKKWLGEREHSTNEIAKYIQVCVDNLQLELADFRRKVLDLGAVEQSKVEQKEAEQDGSEQPENWGIYNKNSNTLVLMIERKPCQYQTKKEAEDAIFNYFQQQRLLGKIKHYKAVLISEILKRIEQKEAEQSEPILPAPEQKEAEQIETEQPETADASAGKDGWAYAIWADIGAGEPRLYVKEFVRCVPHKNYAHILATQNKPEALRYENIETARNEIDLIKSCGADKGNQFGACNLRPVLICTDENAADFNKPDGSELHKSDSKDLGGADGADSPTRAGYSYIVIVNHKHGGVPLYLLDFEQISCDGVPDMSIETTYTKQRAYKFDHIKQAQNFIDLTIECDAHKGYNFFIDTLQ